MSYRALAVTLVVGSMICVGLIGTSTSRAVAGDAAAMSVPAAMLLDSSVTVTPDNQLSDTLLTNTTDTAVFVALYENGDESAGDEKLFDLSCQATGGSCSLIGGSSITLVRNGIPVGVGDTIEVEFTTPSTANNSWYVTLNVTAKEGNLNDSGSRWYRINLPMDVRTNTIPASVTQYSDATATFDVENTSSSSQEYVITCSWRSSPLQCNPTPATVEIGAGTDTTVIASFDAGAITGDYPISLTATALGASDTATDSVSVDGYGAVNIVANKPMVFAAPSGTDTATFNVQFPGQSSSSFDLACTPTSICTVLDSLPSLGDSAQTVRIGLSAPSSASTDTVAVTVTKSNDTAVTASDDVILETVDEVVLDVEGANPGRELIRSECPNIAVGAGAIVCDDFQYVYSFTPVTRMNRTRQLALIHNSAVGAPQGRVNLDFVLPPGGTLPDTVRARLEVAGNKITDWSGPETWQAYPDSTWMGATYELGEKYRIAFPWEWHNVPGNPQVHDVKVIFVQVFNGTGEQEDTVSGYTTSLDRRHTLPVSWWIGGWEFINPDTEPVTGDPVLVWHSGDFSTRVYEQSQTDSTVYVGWTRSRPDTIEVQGSNYVRKLHGGGEVHFDAWGFNTMTVSPTSDTTFFGLTWPVGCCTRPTSVSVSIPGNKRDTIYALDYDSLGILDAVRVTGANGGWDTFDIVADTFTDASEVYIKSITDPSGATTAFEQLPNWAGNPGYPLGKIIGPAGDTTDVGYLWDGSVGGVDTVKIQATSVDLTMPYVAAARVGMYWWDAEMTTRPVDRVYSKLDGPDTVATDTTAFYVNGFGGVRGIGDALGNATWIDREDPSFPSLPTRVRYPNGWQVEASYNSLGLPDTVIDRSNGGATAYEWDAKWSKPTKITSPDGVVTSFRYNASTGVRLRQAVDGDSVRYHYTGSLLDSLLTSEGVKMALSYDAVLGNLIETVESDSIWTRYERDSLGRPTQVRRPISATDSMYQNIVYDFMGRDSIMETGNSEDLYRQRTETYHDAAGRRTKVIPMGGYNTTLPDTGVVNEWQYDDLSRVIVERKVGRDSVAYDLAGNVTERYTANGDTVLNTYDALGRLTARWQSGRTYGPSSGAIDTFPVYSPTGLTIDSVTTVFSYDVMGRLEEASNSVSKVFRTYAPNGQLLTDSLAIARYDNGTFGLHGYMLRYEYDQDGRRVALHHPSWLSGGSDRTAYSYDSKGLMSTVTDPLGQVVSFTYDDDGRGIYKHFPGSGADTVTYDGLGRVTARSIHAGGQLFIADTVTWDPRDKILSEEGTADIRYSGLGQVDSMYMSPPSGAINHEFFVSNGLGNLLEKYQLTNEGPDEYFSRWDHSYFRDGRLQHTVEVWNRDEPTTAPNDWEPGGSERFYDAAGNVRSMNDSSHAWSITETSPGFWEADKLTTYRSESRSYYDALGQLRYHQVNRDSLNNIGQWDGNWGVWEEYRYDPLGRRIFKLSRQDDPHCEITVRCRTSMDRFVWDGDQLLWELREPDTSDTQQPGGSDYTGTIGYVHVGQIDGPVALIRNGSVILPHRNWRGMYAFGTDTSGDQVGCHPFWYSGCKEISWPANSWYTYFNKDERETPFWYGSLIAEHSDATGLLYRRNRYYDPETGQFTQADPIGIAGGLNLYGYAEGDPVNLSDPFGLTVCGETEELREGIEAAASATIQWDEDGCVSSLDNVEFRGGAEWEEVQAAFAVMVNDREEWNVLLGTEDSPIPPFLPPGGARSWFDGDTRTAYIHRQDYSQGTAARYQRCGLAGALGRTAPYDLGGLVAHELLGHGRWRGTIYASHSTSRLWQSENVYNESRGRPRACPRR